MRQRWLRFLIKCLNPFLKRLKHNPFVKKFEYQSCTFLMKRLLNKRWIWLLFKRGGVLWGRYHWPMNRLLLSPLSRSSERFIRKETWVFFLSGVDSKWGAFIRWLEIKFQAWWVFRCCWFDRWSFDFSIFQKKLSFKF